MGTARPVSRLVGALTVLLLAGSAQAGQLRVAWDPNSEPDVTGYTLSYGSRAGVYDRTIDVSLQYCSSSTCDFTITGLTDGQLYYIAVQAYNALGLRSAYSNEVNAVVPRPSNPLAALDTPANGAAVSSSFTVAGWTADFGALSGTGVSQVQVFATPAGGSPVLLGNATYGLPRPDVGAAYGSQFTNSGYSLTVSSLTPGASYQIVVRATSTVSNTVFASPAVNIIVQNTPNPNTRVSVNRTGLYFGATGGGSVYTGAQTAMVNFSGGSAGWTVSSNQPWLTVSPSSGSGAGAFNVTVAPGTIAAGTTQFATVTITAPGVANSPLTLPVQLTGYGATGQPQGYVEGWDTLPTVTGSVAITGWAIDEIGVTEVNIWRDPVPGEGGEMFVGRAVQVDGARVDVDNLFSLPWDYKAGWGYLLLTNMLPYQGNGMVRLHAYATDVEGNRTLIGSRTINCDNAHATKPFGGIDTPEQGGTASGTAYMNWGWALTPRPNTIPTNGSTITVFIDGVPVGHPVYNLSRPDILSLFPGLNNSNGAVGYFQFDTTTLANGVHQIAWAVTDNAGNTEGIGSRFFTVLNTATASVLSSATAAGAPAAQTIQTEPAHEAATAAGPAVGQMVATILADPVSTVPVYVQAGLAQTEPLQIVEPIDNEPPSITTEPLGRVRVALGAPVEGSEDGYEGYVVNDGELGALPIGSLLDRKSGEFYWQPGVGFVGTYEFVFVRTSNGARERIPLTVHVQPAK